MNFDIMTMPPQFFVALLAATSASLAIIGVFWSYCGPDLFHKRLRKVLDDRESVRLRDRARLSSNEHISLRTEPKKLYKAIVERFKLAGQVENSDTVRMLRRGGYRGRAPVVTFVALRLLMPPLMFVPATIYIFSIVELQLPFVVKLALALGIGYLGSFAPFIFVKNRIGKRQLSIRRAWPEALDLLLICVESGMSIESALRKVADEIGSQSIELAEELTLTTAEMSYLPERRRAFENLAERTGVDIVRAVVTSLIQAEKYGTSLGQSLRVLAQECRDSRMSDAEKKAAALPPKLTVPMILFFLPVLFAVILGPAGIQIANMP